MGDDEAGASGQERLQGPLDLALGAGVHAGGGLVQDQDARIGQGGAGDGQELALALAEPAALPQDGLVALGEALDEGVGVGQTSGGVDPSSVASGRPTRMLFSTVSLKRKLSWRTIPIWRRRDSAVTSRTSVPSIFLPPPARRRRSGG